MLWSLETEQRVFLSLRWMSFLGTIVLVNQASQVYKVISDFKRLITNCDACRCAGVDGHPLGFGGVYNVACL